MAASDRDPTASGDRCSAAAGGMTTAAPHNVVIASNEPFTTKPPPLRLLRHSSQVVDHLLVLADHNPGLSLELPEPLLHASQVGAPLHLDIVHDVAQPLGNLTPLPFLALFD
jgi:hypothetical protein